MRFSPSAILALLLPLVAAAADDPPRVTPAETGKHLGELVTVEGTVDQVRVSGAETTYLDLGGRYPDHAFSAVVFKSRRAQFPDLESYEGRLVRVTGVVQRYFEKPEIVLSEPGQLRRVEASQSAGRSPALPGMLPVDPR